jgi:menaquinone-specific isochorismate synthase
MPTPGMNTSFELSDADSWVACGAMITFGDMAHIGWGRASWHPFPTDEEKKGKWFYFPDFFLRDPRPWVRFQYEASIAIDVLLKLIMDISHNHEPPKPISWESPSRSLFEEGFHALQQAFRGVKLDKAVLYAFSKSVSKMTKAHRQRALLHIMEYASKTPTYAYGFWSDSEGLMGATPELLFHCHERQLETMALAGTQKASDSDDMCADPKLVREHRIVLDDIASRLSPFGQVHAGSMQLLVLPTLKHLYTPIEVELDVPLNFPSLVKVLHPTPALGGFPRAAAWEWLTEYNRLLPRGRFGAPTGLWMAESALMACFVAIRNVMWDSKSLQIGAGCGLIAESDIKKEWTEILLKTESIKGFLHI